MQEIDQLTIERAKRGDKRAFQTLYDHYAEYVWVQVYRTVNGHHEEAKELFQTIFIRVFQKLRKFKGNSGFSTWLYRLSYNEMMEYFRKRQKYRERHTELSEELHSSATDSDTKEEIELVLQSLEPHERYLLTAREVEGLTFDELAEITGKSSASLRTAISRIKAHLREEYEYE